MSQNSEVVVESVSKRLRTVWWLPLLRGLIMLLLGVLVLIEPLNTLQILAKIMGIFLLIDAAVSLLHGWANRKQTGWRVWLIQGIIDLAFAALILIWPGITAAVLFYLIVIWAVALGTMAIIDAAILAKTKSLTWPWLLAFGLVSTLFGVMLLIKGVGDTAKTVEVIGLVIGLYAFMAGALQIVSAFAVRAVALDLDRAMRGESEVLKGLKTSGVRYEEQKAARVAERQAQKEELEKQRAAQAAEQSAGQLSRPVGAALLEKDSGSENPPASIPPRGATPTMEEQPTPGTQQAEKASESETPLISDDGFGTQSSPDAGAQPVTREQLRNWQNIHQNQQESTANPATPTLGQPTTDGEPKGE